MPGRLIRVMALLVGRWLVFDFLFVIFVFVFLFRFPHRGFEGIHVEFERLSGRFELVDGPASGTRVVANPSPDLFEGQHIKEKGS